MTRILLFTGKGGVGKTTVAAATALRCADAGLRTVVLSTDPAHSLSDAFDLPLGPLASPVTDSLWGQQLDAQERMEESWHDIQGWLREVFAWAGVDGLEAEELSVIPGLDEVFALADIKQYAESGEWDVVVVDCAPTAETIRFLSLPDILSRYMERLFPVGRRVNKMVSPVLSRVTSLPVAGDDVFSAVSRFYDRLDGVREILMDPEQTSVRLVVNPDRMVIAEARRTYTYLSLFGYRVDAVVANRLLPDAVADPWFERWKELHNEHLRTIEDGFAPLPVLKVELAPPELVGLDALRSFG
ncbi:MAG: ArsA family ATPase, partial [Acidimicrobiales bacterium]